MKMGADQSNNKEQNSSHKGSGPSLNDARSNNARKYDHKGNKAHYEVNSFMAYHPNFKMVTEL